MALGSPTAGAPGTSSTPPAAMHPSPSETEQSKPVGVKFFFSLDFCLWGKKSDPFLIALRKAPSKPSDEERPDFGTQQQVAKEGD